MALETLTTENFNEKIQNSKIAILDFWAPWCGPCMMMAPNFKEASNRFPLKVRFAKINTQDFPELSQPYGIRGIPTMIVFKDAKELDRVSGALGTEQIVQWLNSVI